MAKTVSARIRFLRPEEGGRLDLPRDGIKPQLKLGEVFTSCIVRSRNNVSEFEPGVEYGVELEIMFWDQYSDLFDRDEPVQLFDGSRLIAVGDYVSDEM